MTLKNSPCHPGWAVAAAVLVAWASMIKPFDRFADDFVFVQLIVDHGWLGFGKTFGFWRPLGVSLPIWFYQVHPILAPILAVATHLMNCLLMLRAFHLTLGRGRLPFLLVLVFAVFPFGKGAMTWMAAYNYVLVTTGFWLLVLALLESGRALRKTGLSSGGVSMRCLVSYVLTFLTLLGNEVLIFSMVALPLLLWMDEERPLRALFRRDSWRQWMVVASVAAGILTWGVLMKVASTLPKEAGVNLSTMLGFWFRQYTLADELLAGTSATGRALIFYEVGPLQIAIAVAGLGLLVWSLWWRGKAGGSEAKSEAAAPAWRKRNLVVMGGLILFGACLIYVIAGGFSTDSRKKYPVVPLLLWYGGIAWRQWGGRFSPMVRDLWKPLTAGMVVAGTVTTWISVGAWSYLTDANTVVIKKIAAESMHPSASVDWSPNLYAEWKELERTAFRMDEPWTQMLGTEYFRKRLPSPPPPAGTASPPPHLRQIPGTMEFEWK
ncbi:MAG TPA: hypothetical protein VLE43_10125 [Candidatus Saccharimonadia bacterium]|nr:hypothetical protein [Candidatus Saccharimonadia bacterium]